MKLEFAVKVASSVEQMILSDIVTTNSSAFSNSTVKVELSTQPASSVTLTV